MEQRLYPPRLAERFLEWFCADHLIEEVHGDLSEAFHYRVKNNGARQAQIKFYFDVLRFFKPSYFRKTNFTANQLPMLKNYFKISFRNLRKDSFYSGLNIFGLAVGLCLSILIMRYVRFEQNYDAFHENRDQIFRITKKLQINDYDVHEGATGPYILGELLRSDMPDHKVVRISKRRMTIHIGEKKYIEPNIFIMDREAVDVFTFSEKSGNVDRALQDPKGVILTQETAVKYFGTEDPLGKIISLDGNLEFQVTAVVDSYPANSHFHFDLIIPMESTKQFMPKQAFEEWGYSWVYTYIMPQDGTTGDDLSYNLGVLKDKYLSGSPVADRVQFLVQKFSDIHLKSNFDDEIEANGNELIVYGSMASGIIILLIACFNFMNLTTARATRRSKEVCVRKSVGAERSGLMVQFLLESGLVTFISIVAAILLAEVGTPMFNNLIGKEIPSGLNALGTEIPWLLSGFALVTLIAGSYPALYLSHFPPSQLINPKVGNTKFLGAVFIRKLLVTLQFGASLFLIVATLVVYQQISYTRNKELGYNKENLLVLKLGNKESREKAEFLKSEISRLSEVSSLSIASDAPPNELNSWRISSLDPNENLRAMIQVIACDYDYLNTLGLTLVEGRDFSKDRPTDAQEAILLNEAAVKSFGLENPVGHEFDLMEGMKKGVVIGVVKDYHLSSLHEEIVPVLINLLPSWNSEIIVRVNSDNLPETISTIESIWNQNIASWPFEYSFLDENLDSRYRSEMRMGESFLVFSMLAIVIACMGLFGLASFSIQQRVKEIGIRKALGASIAEIIPILTFEFVKLLLFSILIAFPVAYYLMDGWLQNFAFHISLDWKLFLLAGLLGMSIAVLTVAYHAIRAARSNPVRALRYE